jgi:hypothetical protein
LIFDKRDNTYRHEEIDEDNPGNGRAPGNQHRHNNPNFDDSNENRNERGLSNIQKDWITEVYSSNFTSKMAIIDKMKLLKLEEEIAGTTTLALIPTEQKLQNFLRFSQVVILDDGLLRVGAKVTSESIGICIHTWNNLSRPECSRLSSRLRQFQVSFLGVSTNKEANQ